MMPRVGLFPIDCDVEAEMLLPTVAPIGLSHNTPSCSGYLSRAVLYLCSVSSRLTGGPRDGTQMVTHSSSVCGKQQAVQSAADDDVPRLLVDKN